MTVLVDGRRLTLDAVVAVAREHARVRLDPAALERMAVARAVVERVAASGEAAYGLTTAVGVLKRIALDEPAAAAYARRMIEQHRVAQGPAAPADVVRATLLVQLNAFASGWPGVRPVIAERLVRVLNDDPLPPMRTLGSVGQADLAPLADLAVALFGDVDLAAGEGLALVTGNAYATAGAALAIVDTAGLLETLETSAALALEGLAGNLAGLDPAVERARPHPGLAASLARQRALLDGSSLLAHGAARNLQDPLSFRTAVQVAGATRDALAHVRTIVETELSASQGNPIVAFDDDRIIPPANFEIAGLAAALDYLRISLATVLGSAAERVVKLLETPWSGLPTGLSTSDDASDAGLAYLGIAVQGIAAEARLLAAPVSFEIVSTSHAEGIEDRTTMAPLAARRTAEMVELGRRVAALELVVAAQAVELRGPERVAGLGRGTAAALRLVRRTITPLAPGGVVPDVEPLVERVAAGAFGLALTERG